jgi:hypothetical protein
MVFGVSCAVGCTLFDLAILQQDIEQHRDDDSIWGGGVQRI